MNTFQASELKPIVAQIIGQSAIDSLTWELFPLKVQGGSMAGVEQDSFLFSSPLTN